MIFFFLTEYAVDASPTAFSTKSAVILREGCSLKIEFIKAILAALLLASALVGQVCEVKRVKCNGNQYSDYCLVEVYNRTFNTWYY